MVPVDVTESFHEGERALQSRTGARERLAALGPQLIRDYMPEQHRTFFAQLPFVIAGSVNREGQPWASLLCNPPGFMHSPDPRRLSIAALPMAFDPLHHTLASGADIALLGIEQHTRRRNRMNGVVAQVNATGFAVEVKQSFGNCPKYIQARQAEYWERTERVRRYAAATLNPTARRLIESADTFFIATAHPATNNGAAATNVGVDVSHRGGKPGFVKIEQQQTLVVPDFSGNRFFNTLGNLQLNPRAGLLFIDFANGDLLYLTTAVETIFDGPAVAAFTGAERLLRFNVLHAIYVTAAVPLRWFGEVQLSPFLEPMGDWNTA